MKKLISLLTVFSITLTVLGYFPTPVKAEEINMLSMGKPYTCERYVNPRYPDTDNVELTDGVFASKISYSDSAWSGTTQSGIESGLAYDKWPLYTTVIDLEQVCSVTEVYGSFLREYGTGIGLPRGYRIYASLDNINWMELGYLNNFNGDPLSTGRYTFGWRHDNGDIDDLTDMVDNNNSPVKARYIRYDFEKYTPHNFIDEIVVMGYEGEVSGATAPENTSKLEDGKILTVSEENTGGIQDLMLIYNQYGGPSWTPEYYKPYVTYVDYTGASVDTLYDSFLLLALKSPNGRVMDNDNDVVTIDDWNWYLERTFVGENSDVNNLNKALINASDDLGYKVEGNYVVMIPYPTAEAVNFGEVDGRSLDLSDTEDAKYLIDWYIDKVLSYVENDYSHLNFKGFYWVHESASRIELIKYFNDAVDETGYKSYWIPYYNATGYLWPEELGFDAFTLQPNHFFSETSDDTFGGGGTKIIESTARLAARGNFGVEIEFDGNLTKDIDAYNRGLDYYNAAAKLGYQGDGYFRNWYEGGGSLYGFAYSASPQVRSFYDNTYEIIKGTYKPRKYITSFDDYISNSLLLGKKYTHNGSNWYADRTTDTDSVFLTDGQIGGTYGTSDYYGVQGHENPIIEFDLMDDPIRLSEIHLNFITAGVAGIAYPRIRIWYKPTPYSEWKSLCADTVTSENYVLRISDVISAYALKFEFLSTSSFVFIKEIMAFDYFTGVAHNKDADPAMNTVISVGKPYTRKGYMTPNYPDTDNKELTDGVYGELDPADEAWTGGRKSYVNSGIAYEAWPIYSVEIDLEQVCSVSQIYGRFIYDTNPIYQISLPLGVRIYASEDGENWMKLAYISNIRNAPVSKQSFVYGWHTTDVHGVMTDLTGNPDSSVKARYIRLDADPNNGPFLMDEITVIGSKTVSSDSLTLTNLTKLENEGPKKVSEDTGFIRDMALCYQHSGAWTKERFKPLITYVDNKGNSIDTMFDAVLFLSQNNNGRRVYDANTASLKLSDWTDYIDRIFGEGGDVPELNEAAKQASIDLNRPDFKTKLVIMIPYPAELATEFGTIGDRSIDLSVTEDAQYALKWYMDTVIENFTNGGYDYIDFKGLYWMAEGPGRPQLISYCNEYIREMGLKSYWIPYFNSYGYFWNEYLGFDAVTLQPNHFFGDPNENTLGAGGTTIIGTVAKLGGVGNFGVEMEMDSNLISRIDYYNKGLDYLNAAVEYGFDGPDNYRNWYLGSNLIADITASELPDARNFYDYIYQVMQGTYEVKEYLEKMNDNLLLGLPYTHNITDDSVWYADRSNDTNCTYLTDGLAGGGFAGNDFFGVKKSDATIEFAFDEAKSFRELHINSFYDYNAAVRFPRNLKISAKQNGEWVELFSGAVTEKHFTIRFDRLVKAEGLKYEFTINGNFLFIKELMAFDEVTNTNIDVEVTLPPLKGDINHDDVVDESDINLFKRYFAGYDVEIYEDASDVNGDGKITRADLIAIYKLK